jgi:hypothetical protein
MAAKKLRILSLGKYIIPDKIVLLYYDLSPLVMDLPFS